MQSSQMFPVNSRELRFAELKCARCALAMLYIIPHQPSLSTSPSPHHLKTLLTMSTTPSEISTLSPDITSNFNDHPSWEDGDFVLISSDGWRFRVASHHLFSARYARLPGVVPPTPGR